MKSMRKYTVALFFGLALLLLGGCGDSEPTVVAIGAPVPAFSAPMLDGDTVALADLRGKPVLLNVWATWCIPCREEMPDLQAIQDEFASRGLEVVGVSVDQLHAAGDISRFLTDYNIGFMILHDPQARVGRVFRTVGVPETFLIGADGVLLARWFGPIEPEQVRSTIEASI